MNKISFNKIENRDAYSSIRGFVYQVDMTILRWMELDDNAILELENGEDIDVINKDDNGNEIIRKLEQVKYRESNISLNEESVLEILLNFYLHKSKNTSRKIYFRYVSNTNYTVEKPPLFKNKKKGIEVWIELFNLGYFDNTDTRFVIIKNHLKSKTIKFSNDTRFKDEVKLKWQSFNNFLEEEQNLVEFIKDFEWSLENPNYIQIGESVKKKLILLGICKDLEKAESIYSRLFFFVFKLLYHKNEKKLEKVTLYEQIALPDLNQEDNKIFSIINNLLTVVKDKVDVLEEAIKANHPSKIQPLLQSMTVENTNREHTLDFRQSILPLIGRHDEKQLIVNFALEQSNFSWWIITGKGGVGKSRLAWESCVLLP